MIYFQINTPLDFQVRTTKSYWEEVVLAKHPALKEKDDIIKDILFNPDEVRQSVRDENVLLFYKKFDNLYICVVVKRLNGEGFVITAYTTNKMKKGGSIWQRGT